MFERSTRDRKQIIKLNEPFLDVKATIESIKKEKKKTRPIDVWEKKKKSDEDIEKKVSNSDSSISSKNINNDLINPKNHVVVYHVPYYLYMLAFPC